MYFLFAATEPIALSVALERDINVKEEDIIKFDFVFINTHKSYNPKRGIFTVPQTGIYEIHVNMYKGSRSFYNDVAASLFVNKTRLTFIDTFLYPDGFGTAHSSCTIIREFTIGDNLYIKALYSGAYYGDGGARSQFNVKYLGEVHQGI